MLAEEVDKNYYDLDDIIACSSNVLCSFNGNISKDVFGLLGRKAPDMVVDKTFKTEIPLFMAQALHRTCSIELPKAFNTLTQQALKANAKSVSLESLNQHFYCFGTHLALTIAGEEGRMLAETLLNTFVQRVGAIRTCSLDGAAKPKKLDSCEKKLYSISVRTERLMDDWTRGCTSDRKRKANLDVYNSLKY